MSPTGRSAGSGDAGSGNRRLYHYTCTCHGLVGISESGLLLPHYQPMLQANLTWLSTLTQAHPWDLGLTNQNITCDRSAVRLTVAPASPARVQGPNGQLPMQQWRSWAHQRRIPRILCEIIEGGIYPQHWLIATVPLTVTETLIPARGFHAVGPTLPPELDPHRHRRRPHVPAARTPTPSGPPARREQPPARLPAHAHLGA